METFYLPTFIINLLIHVFILFAFLTFFFFFFVSRQIKNHINNEFQDLIQEQVTRNLNALNQTVPTSKQAWATVASYTHNLKKQFTRENDVVKLSNSALFWQLMLVLGLMIMFIVALFFFFKWRSGGHSLELGFTLAENVIIFAFVSFIELYFFLEIAFKYTPIGPNEATKTIIGKMEELTRP